MLRARLEVALAVLFALGAIATMIWPTWIEDLSGLEPDKGSGEAEWWLVALLGLAAVVSALFARRDLRALRARPDGGQ
jgi:hypothetical protein